MEINLDKLDGLIKNAETSEWIGARDLVWYDNFNKNSQKIHEWAKKKWVAVEPDKP